MKKVWMLIMLMVFVVFSAGLTGCSKKEKAVSTKTMEPNMEQTQPAENPAAEKPKDHPAH